MRLSFANRAAEGTPTISGTAQVGQTLTAGMGDIADADGLPATFPGDYTFQWLRVDADGMSNETPIGADAVTYTPVAADAGKKVKVQVSFTDDGGTSEMLTSDAYPSSGTIIDNNTAAVGNPSITGAAQVGMTLTAGPGDIADADGLTTPGYAYQWRRAGADGMDIPGAMGSTYTLTAADAGKEIKVWADFTDDGGYAERRISNEDAAGRAGRRHLSHRRRDRLVRHADRGAWPEFRR